MMVTALSRKQDDDMILIVGLNPRDLKELHLRNFAVIPKVDLERVGVTGIHQLILAAADSDMAMVDAFREELGLQVTVEKRTRPCS